MFNWERIQSSKLGWVSHVRAAQWLGLWLHRVDMRRNTFFTHNVKSLVWQGLQPKFYDSDSNLLPNLTLELPKSSICLSPGVRVCTRVRILPPVRFWP